MITSSISLRTAVFDDAPSVAKLGASVFTTTFGHSVTPQQLEDYLEEAYSLEATQKDIKDPQKSMVVAVSNQNTIAGFALLTKGSTEPCVEDVQEKIELQRIYVDPKFHGNGLGKRLVKELEDMARDQGYKNIWLGVWEENHVAQKFYIKLGYLTVGEHAFDIGGDMQTDHIMLKKL